MSDYESVLAFWKNRNIDTAAKLAEVMNGGSIALAYHSGRIENENITFNDTREIFEHDGVTSYTGDLRTLFEMRNSRDAWEFILKCFGEGRELSESFIHELQYELTKNTYDSRRWELEERPGTYKKHDYVTGKNEIGAAPEDVSEEMQELLDDMRDIPEDKALTAAAFFHAKFENIHPYADGNGRTGRLAMNYFLLLMNHPPIIIHEEDRKEYYSALEAFDERQELKPLIEFLKEQAVKSWERQKNKV